MSTAISMISFISISRAETNSPHDGGLSHVLYNICPTLILPITGTITILHNNNITETYYFQ